ncbi:MAG: PAS domain S-box protein [Nitrospirota bacterium]
MHKETGQHIALGADVGKALITGSNLREALQGCAEAMVRHLDAAFARIWVLNEKEEVLELLASAGMYTHTDGFHSRMHLWKYPYKIAKIARERKPHLTNYVIGDPMIHDQEWARREGMVAFAGYPLTFRDKLVGVVGVFAKKKLSEAALKALEFVADEITVGIERMRSAAALKSSEERLRGIVEESLAGAYIIQDGKMKYINQAMADMYGYDREEMDKNKIWPERVCFPEELPREAELNGKLLSGDVQSLRYEARRRRKDGSVIIVDILRWMTEYDGKPAIIGTALDITDRKRSEEALKESEAKFRSLSEEAPVGIYLIQDFRYAYVNPELCRMLDYSEVELAGMENLLETIHPEDRIYAEEGIKGVLTGMAANHRYQGRWIKKGGRMLEVEGTAAFTVYRGRPAIIGTALDVTERKTLEREKMDFLAMVTHDFKSPLTNILGYSELLLEKSKGDETVEMAEAIVKSGEKLSWMVEDFLFHSRLESGAGIPEMAPGDLKELLKKVCEEYVPQAEKKGLIFQLELPLSLPRIRFDRKLMERAVSNMLQNALTYTPEGGRVTVTAENLNSIDKDFAAISVSDTGPGIPAEFQSKVFDKYFRSPTTAGIRGTGLGLAVVKLVADVHSGKMEVNCPEGVGCTFRMLIPVNSLGKKAA